MARFGARIYLKCKLKCLENFHMLAGWLSCKRTFAYVQSLTRNPVKRQMMQLSCIDDNGSSTDA